MNIKDIIFDEQDRNLFFVDDLSLKADAIRYSILPRLSIINNEIISRLMEVYEFDFYEHFSIVKSPSFRLSKTQRKEPTKHDYAASGIAITGQRAKNKWLGLSKETAVIPQISPTTLSIELNEGGFMAAFLFNYPGNFTIETYQKFFDFFIDNSEMISGLSNRAKMFYLNVDANVYTLREELKSRFDAHYFDLIFFSQMFEYPIDFFDINRIIHANVLFFPVLNACVDIALGKKPNLENDLKLLSQNIEKYFEKYAYSIEDDNDKFEGDLEEVKSLAESKIQVKAGIRWQVFKRDSWKCVACGKAANDNIILHIDHIVPRSKGGKDELNNYQTLCEICNIGKSNKDDTDLRKLKSC